jgi:hypothetical protein
MILAHEAAAMRPEHAAQMAALARKAVFEAGAHGASRQTWIEVARPMVSISFTNTTAALGGLGGNIVPYGGLVTLTTFNLAIGTDLKNILASAGDCENFNGISFKFGNLELFPNGEGSLAVFDPRLEHVDHIAPWIHAKTINDVPVTATVICRAITQGTTAPAIQSAAYFKGYAINVYAEEQVCQITNRLMQTDRSMGTLDSMVQLRGMYSHALGMPLSPVMLQPSAQTGARYTPMPGGAAPPSPQYR